MEASLGFGVEAAELWLQSFGKGGGVQFKLATSRLWEGRALAKAVPSTSEPAGKLSISMNLATVCVVPPTVPWPRNIGVGIMLCLI